MTTITEPIFGARRLSRQSVLNKRYRARKMHPQDMVELGLTGTARTDVLSVRTSDRRGGYDACRWAHVGFGRLHATPNQFTIGSSFAYDGGNLERWESDPEKPTR